jgi:hypothetical protein
VPLELETIERDKARSSYRKVRIAEFWAFRPTFDKTLKEFTFPLERSNCPDVPLDHKGCSKQMVYQYKEGRLVLQKVFLVRWREGKPKESTQIYP